MEISWALIINYPNYLNLLNLRNYSISQSINRGLGAATKQSIFGEKIYAGGISSESWSSRTQIPLVGKESLYQELGCILILFTAC